MTDDGNIHRVVYFFPFKDKLFSSIEDLKKLKIAENDNIIVKGFTSAKQIDLHFEKKITKKFSIKSIINECALYDIVDISVLVFNLQELTTVVKDGKPLRLRRGMIKDSSDKMPIIIFESLIEQKEIGTTWQTCEYKGILMSEYWKRL